MYSLKGMLFKPVRIFYMLQRLRHNIITEKVKLLLTPYSPLPTPLFQLRKQLKGYKCPFVRVFGYFNFDSL